MKQSIIMGVVTLVLSASCAHRPDYGREDESATHMHGAEIHAGHSDEIILTPEQARAAGVEAETVRPRPFRRVIPASGQVLAAQGEERTVVAHMAGIVSLRRPLTAGANVARGVVLMELAADRLPGGDPAAQARVAWEAARADYERAVRLAKDQIVSQKALAAARERYEAARLAWEAVAPRQTGTGVTVVAPTDGYVASCFVDEGDYVSVGQPLVSIARSRRLFLKADVPERYYSALSAIRTAHFRTPYINKVYALDELDGRLVSCGKAEGDGAHFVPVTFEFDNPGDIVPGAYVEVNLLSAEADDVIALPVSALTEEQGTCFVYVQVDEEGYRRQEVTTGATNGREVEILSGVREGDRVVIRGAYQVRLASASHAIPAHTHEH